MIAMANDKRLKELGFQLLLTIHDEVVGQCPTENLDEVKQIVNSIMTHSGDGILNVPMVCDTSDEPSGHWYMSEEETAINSRFNNLIDGYEDEDTHQVFAPVSKDEAYKQVCDEFPELLPDNIYNNLFKGEYLR